MLGQTRQQLSSPDGRHLLGKGVSEMVRNIVDTLRAEVYTTNELQPIASRRLVDCLPELNRWAQGVWEGVPDSGVEVRCINRRDSSELKLTDLTQGLLSLPDYESFAALIFGDWA